MGYRTVTGKKCIIYHNSSMDRHRTPRGEGYIHLPKPHKEFEVFKCDAGISYTTKYFPDDTPHYSKEGYDTLEEAKVFFLLMEI